MSSSPAPPAWAAARCVRPAACASPPTATCATAGRRVTTHWAYCGTLAARYPDVTVEPDPIFVRALGAGPGEYRRRFHPAAGRRRIMQIAILLYDQFTVLDAIGPYQVLSGIPDAEPRACRPASTWA